MQDRLLFSYASPDDPRLRRVTIRAIERLTGQPRLKRIYLDNQRRPRPGESFWEAAVRHLRLEVDYDPARLGAIPAAGPVVVVANHPFGVLDGLVIGYLIAKVRPDFKVLTHNALYRAPELQPYLLPIDFGATRSATATNLGSRAAALAWLREGGVLVAFPAGGVSTAGGPFARAGAGRALEAVHRARDHRDAGERAAGLLRRPEQPAVPDREPRQPDPARGAAVPRGAQQARGRVSVRIGAPLTWLELAQRSDRHELIAHLRRLTYALGEPGGEPRPRPRRRLAAPPGPCRPGRADRRGERLARLISASSSTAPTTASASLTSQPPSRAMPSRARACAMMPPTTPTTMLIDETVAGAADQGCRRSSRRARRSRSDR